MNRRDFFKVTAAFPAAAMTAALVVREDGKPPVELDVSVLRTQPGDVLVLSVPGPISHQTAKRLEAYIKDRYPYMTAIVMSDGMKLDGVLRTA